MGAIDKAMRDDPNAANQVELDFTIKEIKQLIGLLGSKHPLVGELRRQLNLCVSASSKDKLEKGSALSYLAQKLKVSNMEHLFSKALSLAHWGVELEERGYEVQAVKRNIFTKEVIRFKIGR